MAHELVFEAQALRVHHPVLGEHDGVVERGAESEAARPQALHVGEEAEGARPGDLAAEDVGIDLGGEALAADKRIGEVDLDLDAPALMRQELGEGMAHLDAHRLLDPDVTPRRRQSLDPGLVDRVDEGLGAAIHHRHFRAVDLDQAVVDLEGAERRHQVLDGRDRGAGDADRGAQVGAGDETMIGRDLLIPAVIEIGPVEGDAAVGLGRVKGHRHHLAAVDAHARQHRPAAQRRLNPVTPFRHSAVPPLRRPDRLVGGLIGGTWAGYFRLSAVRSDLLHPPGRSHLDCPSALRRIEG